MWHFPVKTVRIIATTGKVTPLFHETFSENLYSIIDILRKSPSTLGKMSIESSNELSKLCIISKLHASEHLKTVQLYKKFSRQKFGSFWKLSLPISRSSPIHISRYIRLFRLHSITIQSQLDNPTPIYPESLTSVGFDVGAANILWYEHELNWANELSTQN